MHEYYSEAVVLDTEPLGELNIRVAFFTKRFGKITARAKSARKITSKLTPHLQSGNLVAARIIEKSGLQVVDALKNRRLLHESPNLHLLSKLLPEAEADDHLWEMLISSRWNWRTVLARLGWDPGQAKCYACKTGKPDFFEVRSQEFFCSACASKLGKSEVISMA